MNAFVSDIVYRNWQAHKAITDCVPDKPPCMREWRVADFPPGNLSATERHSIPFINIKSVNVLGTLIVVLLGKQTCADWYPSRRVLNLTQCCNTIATAIGARVVMTEESEFHFRQFLDLLCGPPSLVHNEYPGVSPRIKSQQLQSNKNTWS
jgi:hypothetical protein